MAPDKERSAYIFRDMPVSKAILTMALPTVASQLIHVAYNLTDTFFVGRMNDPAQVAAATIAFPMFALMTGLANLFGIGGASTLSRALGKEDRDKAREAGSFAIWGSASVALVYGIVLWILRGQLLPVLGAKTETYGFSSDYLLWTVTIGAVPTTLSSVLAHLVRAEGYSKEAGFGLSLGGFLNIVLDPIFIFGFHLQIKGAAMATALSNMVTMAYFVRLFYVKNFEAIRLRRVSRLRRGLRGEVLGNGVSAFLMAFMAMVSNVVLNHIIAGYATEAVAGMGIAKKVNTVAFSVSQGITQGALALIAYNYAADDRKRMKEVIDKTMLFTILQGVVATAAVFALAPFIMRLFINNADTVAYGTQFQRVICLAYTSTGCNFMIITIFQATNEKRKAFWLSLLRKGGLDVPLMLGLNALFAVSGVAWATPAADYLALVIEGLVYLTWIRRRTASQA